MPTRTPARLAALGLALAAGLAHAATTPPQPSAMDAPLFYEVLVGEMLARQGTTLEAVQSLLAAAERARDSGLYQRAFEVALQGRRPDLARAVAQTWQRSLPQDAAASRAQLHLAVAAQDVGAIAGPLARLVNGLPLPERAGAIASVPRFLAELPDRAAAYAAARTALEPMRATQGLAVPVEVALARLALAAGQPQDALSRARRAAQADPAAPGPALVALDVLDTLPSAQPLLDGYLARPDAAAPVRLAYARWLADQQHLGPAATQAERATQAQPDLATAWLTLAAYRVELREPAAALTALAQWRTLPTEGVEADALAQAERFASLLSAQATLHLGDLPAATRWLDQLPEAERTLSAQLLRARVLAREGRLAEGRALLRSGPAAGDPEPLPRLRAEAQLLREEQQWPAALALLGEARQRWPDERGLTLEWAMVAEQLGQHDAAERALRGLLDKQADDADALNALGYGLADRSVRLDEAQALLARAAALAPRNPFITDSVGWLAFRQGRPADALPLLERSFALHPHAEVAAHLGEVLWVLGRQDDARAVWRDGLARESSNTVLQETLKRLGVTP